VITITWDTRGAVAGTYRIVHRGDRKSLTGKILPYEGVTRTFTVEREAARSGRVIAPRREQPLSGDSRAST
jgi:hypothetical protein